MIWSARWGLWETNSSTINQVVICKLKNDLASWEHPLNIIIDQHFPNDEGDTVHDFYNKTRIMWALLQELKTKDEESAALFENILFEILKKNHVEYQISPFVKEEDMCNIEVFGMGGPSTECIEDMFANPDLLEQFLFDNRSYFIWGYMNDFKSHNLDCLDEVNRQYYKYLSI